MGIPVELMSRKDLEDRSKDLSERAAGLKADLEDRERQVEEKKERAVLFETLFKEGVVSRRELENAGKEASLMDKELKVNRDELKDLNKALTAIADRLKKLGEEKQPKVSSGKAAPPVTKKPMDRGKSQSTASR